MKRISYLITFSICMVGLNQSQASFALTKTNLLPIDSVQKIQVDPVCKMKVKQNSSKSTDYNKVVYYFCSESCKQKFLAKPTNYVKNK